MLKEITALETFQKTKVEHLMLIYVKFLTVKSLPRLSVCLRFFEIYIFHSNNNNKVQRCETSWVQSA